MWETVEWNVGLVSATFLKLTVVSWVLTVTPVLTLGLQDQ